MPERKSEVGEDAEPHLLPALKRRLRNAFFDNAYLVEPPGLDWLVWGLDPDDAKVLRLQGERVAIGSADDHQRIKEGVRSFLADGFKDHQKRFSEIERLRHDMMLMQGVVGKSLEAITADEIRRGICPACPYPEASLEPDTDPNAGRPIAQRRKANG